MRRVIIAIIIVIAVIAADGLGRGHALSREAFCMNTLFRVSVFGSDERVLREALDDVFDLFFRLDKELSLYREGSFVWRVNESAGLSPVPVPEDLRALVMRAVEIGRLTGGLFNPLIGPITQLWKINQVPGEAGNFRLPALASVDAALPLTDLEGVAFPSGGVHLRRRGAMLDLGGIAKGYASSRAVELLRERGISSALLDLGGNIQVLGTNHGKPWNIGIRDPRGRGVALVLSVSDTAVITSGSYERYKIVDGVRYSHLFDPRTGMPVRNGLLSATVVTPDGALADALATAFMVLGREGAAEFLRGHPELGAVLIAEAGDGGMEVFATEGLRGRLRRQGGEGVYDKIKFIGR